MIIAIIPNTQKASSINIATDICHFLHHQGVIVTAEDDIASSIGARLLSEIDPKSIDFVISIGGDGTILRLVHRHPELHAPIMPINLGSFGFMADIQINAIYPSLENLLKGNYKVQYRMMMEGETKSQNGFAVNEIAIHRARNPSLIDLAIFVDERYLNTFSADGIIVSTPTGSTAYSLAAGGPILTPDLNAFVLTPICPHTISNRPIVLMPEKDIRIEYISAHEPVEVIYDGFSCSSMVKGESIQIKISNRKFPLVNMPEHDFFFTLRTKLGWTGKLKS